MPVSFCRDRPFKLGVTGWSETSELSMPDESMWCRSCKGRMPNGILLKLKTWAALLDQDAEVSLIYLEKEMARGGYLA